MDAAPMDNPLLSPRLAQMAASFAHQRVALPSGASVGVRTCGQVRGLPPVVLLHGISSGSASWLEVALRLSEQTKVLAWDAPGYGESTPLAAASPTDADYASRLRELLLALGLTDALLVGHSLGALMAMAYAREWGAPGMVLISPARGYGAADQADTRAKVRAERAAALQRLGVAGLAAGISSRLLSAGATDAQRAWVGWNTARLHPEGYLQAVALLCQSTLARSGRALAPTDVPTEVYCGDADVVTPPGTCRDWAEANRLPFALIPDAGHASPVEQPDAVAQLILGVLQRSSGVSRHG